MRWSSKDWCSWAFRFLPTHHQHSLRKGWCTPFPWEWSWPPPSQSSTLDSHSQHSTRGHKGMGCMAGTAPSHFTPSPSLLPPTSFSTINLACKPGILGDLVAIVGPVHPPSHWHPILPWVFTDYVHRDLRGLPAKRGWSTSRLSWTIFISVDPPYRCSCPIVYPPPLPVHFSPSSFSGLPRLCGLGWPPRPSCLGLGGHCGLRNGS